MGLPDFHEGGNLNRRRLSTGIVVSKVVIAVSEENNISIFGVRQTKLSQP